MTTLEKLQAWYRSRCNSDWEHQHGVVIETLDNPGWSVRIDLEGSELIERPYAEKRIERSESDWMHCRVANGIFEGFGGIFNLEGILDSFLEWAALPKALLEHTPPPVTWLAAEMAVVGERMEKVRAGESGTIPAEKAHQSVIDLLNPTS